LLNSQSAAYRGKSLNSVVHSQLKENQLGRSKYLIYRIVSVSCAMCIHSDGRQIEYSGN